MAASTIEALGRNPFVGPRPIQAGEPLHGRSAEVEQLLRELKARRVVVLHSASGAGKSSLVEAGLVPQMKRAEFDVWKTIRVSPDRARFEGLPEGTNPYVLSALLSLEDELPTGRRRGPGELAEVSFADYVETRPRRRKRVDQNVALIFDQLEEVLSAARADEAKREFFQAIGQVLENPGYWALLVVRDELLAKLTLYQQWLPTRMSSTFHLDLLSLEGASQAIAALAGEGGRSFSELDELVEDLSRSGPDGVDRGSGAERAGWVEPLRLQVACRRLWDATPTDSPQIDRDRLGPGQDVGVALGAYYGEAMTRIANGDSKLERELRDWVGRVLIDNGRRAQLRGDELARAGLELAWVEQLRAYDLVRTEAWAGSDWLELGHPRLIRAIQADNEGWNRANPRLLARLEELVPSLSSRAARTKLGHPDPSVGPSPGGSNTLRSAPVPSEHDAAGDGEASEASWVTFARPARAAAPDSPDPQPPKMSPTTRALFTDVARRSLEASETNGGRALLGVALSTLATVDSKWTFVAATTSGSSIVDVDKLIEQLQMALTGLVDEQAYASLAEDERPTVAELIAALVDLGDALCRTRGPRKRELLLAAFRAGFRPEYFATGLSPHLWDIARRIEYPELRLLETMLRDHEVGAQIGLRGHEHGAFFVRKLCELGLVNAADRLPARAVVLSEMAPTFQDFLRAGVPDEPPG